MSVLALCNIHIPKDSGLFENFVLQYQSSFMQLTHWFDFFIRKCNYIDTKKGRQRTQTIAQVGPLRQL